MNKPTFIYTLSDPRNGAVRYVGMSKNPRRRWYQHHQCTSGSNEKKAWIQELKMLRMKTALTILEEVQGHTTAWEREKYWIDTYTEQGAPLTNWNLNEILRNSDCGTRIDNPALDALIQEQLSNRE